MKNLDFYHAKEDSKPLNLTKEETYDLDADWEDLLNQRQVRDKEAQIWRWSGSVYNVVQSAQPDDRISQITLGWIRSYVDTGIAQMTAGEPEFSFEGLTQSDSSRTILWKNMVETVMSRCGFMSHQKVAMTDAHIFGPGVFEVYQQRPFRTIREPQLDGTFKERVIMDHRIPRVGVRAISPFRCTRNPNVSDPNEVGSCSKEEILSWNQFVQNYGRVTGVNGKPKFKHIDQIVKGSHVKVTVYQDEIRDVYRIYALSYGNKSDGESEIPPEGLGIPIFDRPLKIHDIYNKGELIDSLGLNIPGMCNLVFLPYADKLTSNYQEHAIYGMGLPEQMEGLDTFMQTAFNMSVDRWVMEGTVVLDIESRDGTMPDFDANTYYGGEFINAKVTPQSLGTGGSTIAFDNMYEVIQKLAIPGTGININAIAGDTSKTAFEFAQRIEANNKRTEMRLKEWEQGPLKRLGTLLLSAAISELTVHDLENIREGDAKKILQDIEKGRATRDDFEFKGGKPEKRKTRYYIDVKGMKESFTPKRKSRYLNSDSTENTLVKDKKNPEAINKIPVTEEYVLPDWYVESGILFDTKVDSKRMITNKKIRDTQALQSVINNFMTLIQIDPQFAQSVDIPKLFDQILRLADMDSEDIVKEKGQSETADLLEKIKMAKESVTGGMGGQTGTVAGSMQLPLPEQPNQAPQAPQDPLASIA